MVGRAESAGGQVIGEYRLLRLLGQGHFANVYLGVHQREGTQVAIKVMRRKISQTEQSEFITQAQKMARLAHPNIVRILDIGIVDNMPYLVMDYASQGTLRQRHPQGTPLPLRTVVSYVKQIARALQYAHNQYILHGTLKPENMLAGRYNEILLSDFAISQLLADLGTSYLPRTANTIAYIAPEQLQLKPVPASDQYSLGVIVYEWLSGSCPFRGTFADIAIAHALYPPPPLRDQIPGLPPEVEQVVMIALNKDPLRRFATIRAFAVALEQASLRASSASVINTVQPPVLATAPDLVSTVQTSPVAASPLQEITARQKIVRPALQHIRNTQIPQLDFPQATSIQPDLSIYPTQPLPSESAPVEPVTPIISTPSLPHLHRRTFMKTALISSVAIGGLLLLGYTQRDLLSQFFRGLTVPNQNKPAGGDLLFTYRGHTDLVTAVAWSPSGNYIASCAQDGTVQIWNTKTGTILLTYAKTPLLDQTMTQPSDLIWSPADKWIAVGFLDGVVQGLDIATGNQNFAYTLPAGIRTIAASPDGKHLALGCQNNAVYILEVKTGNILTTFKQHKNVVLAVAWSFDGEQIASTSADSTVRLWRPFTGQEVFVYQQHKAIVRTVAWSHDNRLLASGGEDKRVHIWQANTGTTLLSYTRHQGAIRTVAWSHKDRFIISGGDNLATHVWEAQQGRDIHIYATGEIQRVSLAPNDTQFVTAGNKVAQIWKV